MVHMSVRIVGEMGSVQNTDPRMAHYGVSTSSLEQTFDECARRLSSFSDDFLDQRAHWLASSSFFREENVQSYFLQLTRGFGQKRAASLLGQISSFQKVCRQRGLHNPQEYPGSVAFDFE